jgi:myo-inositol-1(or 4)-monophosphatase
MPKKEQLVILTGQVNKLLAKKFNRNGTKVHHLKKHSEIVTEADMAANKLITESLLKHFPDDDILSEEAPTIDNPGENIWHIDPLDGTTNFSYGFTYYATCIGLANGHGEVIGGAIGIPEQKEIYVSRKGKGTHLYTKNGLGIKQKLEVSKHGGVKNAMIVGCWGYTKKGEVTFHSILKKLHGKSTRIRLHGCAGVDLVAVASGSADACIFVANKTWDVVAGVALVREAGGKVTDLKGRHWHIGSTDMLATNGTVHSKILKYVN